MTNEAERAVPSQKQRIPKWLAPIALFAAFIALWLTSLWFVPLITKHAFGVRACDLSDSEARCLTDTELLQAYAQTGDLFGAANALFAGLALAGVALTLWLQTRDRRRDARPLLIPLFETYSNGGSGSSERAVGSIQVAKPSTQQGSVVFPLEFDVPLLNQSTEAALNVEIRAELFESDDKIPFERAVAVPIGAQHSQTARLEVNLSGPAAKKLQSQLESREGAVQLAINITYSNLDGIRWRTAVTYLLSLDPVTRDRDSKLLSDAVDPSLSPGDGNPQDAGWQPNTRIALHAEPRAGSWHHGEV